MTSLLPRLASARLLAALREYPLVVLTGMRGIGKAAVLRSFPGLAKRRTVDLSDLEQLEAAKSFPQAILQAPEPVTIEEIQRCPEIMLYLEGEILKNPKAGRILITGTADFSFFRGVSERLAGRAKHIHLYPITRHELTGKTNKPPFFIEFLRKPAAPRQETKAVSATDIFRGGLPQAALAQTEDLSLWRKSFEQRYLERDTHDYARVDDLLGFRRLLRLAALRSGTPYSPSELGREAELNAMTASRYLSLMDLSLMTWRVPAFLGSRASRVVKSPKLYLSDSGLACHLAGFSDAPALERGASFRGMLETYAAQNLAALLHAHRPEASLRWWGVQGRHEVSFVVEDGRECWAFEVRPDGRWTDANLSPLRAFLQHAPQCRAAVLAHNGTESARLGDKLWAVPLGALLA